MTKLYHYKVKRTVAYSVATPRTSIDELVDAWICDYVEHGDAIAERNVLADGMIVHNKIMKDLDVKERSKGYKAIDFKKIKNGDESDIDIIEIPINEVRKQPTSPSIGGTGSGCSPEVLNSLNLKTGGDDNDENPDEDGDDNDNGRKDRHTRRQHKYDDDGDREFGFVNPEI